MALLSICIPTYNRASYLSNTLAQLTREAVFQHTDDIEIIISDNCSDDNTEDVCKYYVSKYGSKIVYIRQPENIRDKNFAYVLSQANGTYAKLNNDNLYFRKGGLERVVTFLKEHSDCDIMLFSNGNGSKQSKSCSTFDELLSVASFYVTWIGGLCIKTQEYKKLPNPDRYAHLNFSQVDIMARIMSMGKKAAFCPDRVFDAMPIWKKGGYGIPRVFGKNYLTIINEIFQQGFITPKVYEKHKKDLLKFINENCFNRNRDMTFSSEGYFQYLYPHYWKKIYFYVSYIVLILKQISPFIYSKKSTDSHRKYRVLFFKFSIKKKKKKARTNAKYQIVTPSKQIEVGRYTYGTIDARIVPNRSEKLIIGEFCSIGPDVVFLVSVEHPYRGLSTYPFKTLIQDAGPEAESKGDIVVDDDVWIGTRAIICSGVHIGKGAIVAAGAVVTKDIPPYAIVGGNPAKLIRYRFSEPVISKLLEFDFSKLTEEKIISLQGSLYKELNEDNVEELLQKYSNDI